MALPMYSMFVDYVCCDCDVMETRSEIIPKLACPQCGYLFEVVEENDEAIPKHE